MEGEGWVVHWIEGIGPVEMFTAELVDLVQVP